jgi:hypothetical protein
MGDWPLEGGNGRKHETDSAGKGKPLKVLTSSEWYLRETAGTQFCRGGWKRKEEEGKEEEQLTWIETKETTKEGNTEGWFPPTNFLTWQH